MFSWCFTLCQPPRSFQYDYVLYRAVRLSVACLTSLKRASISQGKIGSDNFTCCHTEIQVADQTFYLTQSQPTDTGPASPSADPITPGTGRVATGVSIFKSLVSVDPEKIPTAQAGFEPGVCHSLGGTASLAKWLRRPPRERKIRGSNPT